jgi:Restriction endonuclease
VLLSWHPRITTNGKARIGWSSEDDHDLRLLKDKIGCGEWGGLRPDQQDAAKCIGFLDRVQGGDYLLYPHQPKSNHLLIAQVKDGPDGNYSFSPPDNTLDGDFRSCRGCVLLTPNPVPYNDTILLPYVQSRLGLQGRFYELRGVDTLQFTLDKLDCIPRFSPEPKSIVVRLNRIRDAISPRLPALIQQEFLRQDLSWFCCELFRKLGYTVQYQEGAGEHGSDLVVEIRSELLPRSLRIGVQVKSYTDAVSLQTFQHDIQPLIDGWQKNALDYGAYLTTGLCDPKCLEHLQEHNASHADRQVVLIDGSEFARLLIKAIGRFGIEDE